MSKNEDDVRAVAEALRRTREYAAGAAFSVPIEARASHSEALAEAAIDALAPAFARIKAEGYAEGIQRGRRVVADPNRFPIQQPDYTNLRNEKRA